MHILPLLQVEIECSKLSPISSITTFVRNIWCHLVYVRSTFLLEKIITDYRVTEKMTIRCRSVTFLSLRFPEKTRV